eukprot:1161997-Pelagomonas_calceolata.AAC.4
MRDPVLATDGYSYERAAIEQWFRSHDTSPMSNQVSCNAATHFWGSHMCTCSFPTWSLNLAVILKLRITALEVLH